MLPRSVADLGRLILGVRRKLDHGPRPGQIGTRTTSFDDMLAFVDRLAVARDQGSTDSDDGATFLGQKTHGQRQNSGPCVVAILARRPVVRAVNQDPVPGRAGARWPRTEVDEPSLVDGRRRVPPRDWSAALQGKPAERSVVGRPHRESGLSGDILALRLPHRGVREWPGRPGDRSDSAALGDGRFIASGPGGSTLRGLGSNVLGPRAATSTSGTQGGALTVGVGNRCGDGRIHSDPVPDGTTAGGRIRGLVGVGHHCHGERRWHDLAEVACACWRSAGIWDDVATGGQTWSRFGGRKPFGPRIDVTCASPASSETASRTSGTMARRTPCKLGANLDEAGETN